MGCKRVGTMGSGMVGQVMMRLKRQCARCLHNVVLAKARTHNHQAKFGEDSR